MIRSQTPSNAELGNGIYVVKERREGRDSVKRVVAELFEGVWFQIGDDWDVWTDSSSSDKYDLEVIARIDTDNLTMEAIGAE
jgi:hypothetical protein